MKGRWQRCDGNQDIADEPGYESTHGSPLACHLLYTVPIIGTPCCCDLLPSSPKPNNRHHRLPNMSLDADGLRSEMEVFGRCTVFIHHVLIKQMDADVCSANFSLRKETLTAKDNFIPSLIVSSPPSATKLDARLVIKAIHSMLWPVSDLQSAGLAAVDGSFRSHFKF